MLFNGSVLVVFKVSVLDKGPQGPRRTEGLPTARPSRFSSKTDQRQHGAPMSRPSGLPRTPSGLRASVYGYGKSCGNHSRHGIGAATGGAMGGPMHSWSHMAPRIRRAIWSARYFSSSAWAHSLRAVRVALIRAIKAARLASASWASWSSFAALRCSAGVAAVEVEGLMFRSSLSCAG